MSGPVVLKTHSLNFFVSVKFVMNGTRSRYNESIAFVRGGAGGWRSIEWALVPDAVKDSLFNKAIAKAA